jgi:hypothetical protein
MLPPFCKDSRNGVTSGRKESKPISSTNIKIMFGFSIFVANIRYPVKINNKYARIHPLSILQKKLGGFL